MRDVVARVFSYMSALRLNIILAYLSAAALSVVFACAALAAPVDFNSQVRPILSNNCFKCHGFDPETRKAARRLDTREGALAEKDGVRAVVPGKLDESDLSARIHSTDADEQMPPAKSGKTLSKEQIAILDRWLVDGAPYETHWAFQKPVQAPLPVVSRPGWCRNAIDRFVLARLDREGLAPSAEADAYTLIRRVSLDLTGIPPTPEEADAFANDPSEDRYERLVDRLLTSPRYGEKWARRWLDLARYSDTNGFEKDRDRPIWPYRDWVIKALNAGMPFDEFTIKQLAGDLLPNPSVDDRVATGFHRNTMLNEEGGIDPLEYRFNAIVDRVATTGATWLGMTIQCAQCHTHKYDPITNREYYQFMAFLNNADEPELDLPPPDLARQQQEREEKLAKLIAELPQKFPLPRDTTWQALRPSAVETSAGESPKLLDDGSELFPGASPDKAAYVFHFDAVAGPVEKLRIEALPDASLPHNGPGRAENGNFVLGEIRVIAAPADAPDRAAEVKLGRAETDGSQNGFPVESAIDGKEETGWAVDLGSGKLNSAHTAIFTLDKPIQFPSGARLTVTLSQQYGRQHTLGRVRISAGANGADSRPEEARRRDHLQKRFAEWLDQERKRTVNWTVLRPVEMKSNLPLLTLEPSGAIFVSGDMTKSDWYDMKFQAPPAGITAVRLEVLPDERLPAHGPGRVYYEGNKGDFFLSEFTMTADGGPVRFAKAASSYASDKFAVANAIDGDPQSGWSIDGKQGLANEAVFALSEPLAHAGEIHIRILCERYYAAALGKFRISATSDPAASAEPRSMSDDAVRLLLVPDARLSTQQRERLRPEFLLNAPELAAARKEIDALRKPIQPQTSLVMQERPPANPRPTQIHHRGEFLQTREAVQPEIFSALGTLPAGAPRNRLGLARWLVSTENPLTARVVMNRDWSAFFGRGIVRTIGDFGFQGDPPSHPELLDWLAVEFVKQGWTVKRMHKLIVMSAAYRQSSATTKELAARDPENALLARGPRFRLDAEAIRDSALLASGQLVEKIGGPSVRPPQPAGVMEVAYGSPSWTASVGPDRWRRSLYTYSKRTAPFALYNTFDAPAGEACIVRRDRSDTPLQALALLNDTVFTEAAQALGRRMASSQEPLGERIRMLFRLCLTRPADAEESAALTAFYSRQKGRFESGELSAQPIAGEGTGTPAERAAWTVLARALLNFDEFVTRG